jgi:hypothetical protein
VQLLKDRAECSPPGASGVPRSLGPWRFSHLCLPYLLPLTLCLDACLTNGENIPGPGRNKTFAALVAWECWQLNPVWGAEEEEPGCKDGRIPTFGVLSLGCQSHSCAEKPWLILAQPLPESPTAPQTNSPRATSSAWLPPPTPGHRAELLG